MKLCGVDDDWVSKTLNQNKVEQKNVFMMTANKRRNTRLF